MTTATPPVADLATLLASMRPRLREGAYAFCMLPPGVPADGLDCIATFRDDEGTTVVLAEGTAREAGLAILFRAAWITLAVHSDLQAVGFTAAFATALGAAGIPCNVMAAARHDHVFVPADEGQRALEVLQALQRDATASPG